MSRVESVWLLHSVVGDSIVEATQQTSSADLKIDLLVVDNVVDNCLVTGSAYCSV